MKLERQPILGNTITGYKLVDNTGLAKVVEQRNLPDVATDTAPNDVSRVLLRRLEDESNKLAANNGSH